MKSSVLALAAAATFLLVAPPSHGDEAADKLMKQVARATRAVKTLTADLSMKGIYAGQMTEITGAVKLRKPNYLRMVEQIHAKGGLDTETRVSDGKTVWFVVGDVEYSTYPATPDHVRLSDALPAGYFLNPDGVMQYLTGPQGATSHILPPETVDGVSYQVVEIATSRRTVRLFVGADHLIHRAITTDHRDWITAPTEITLRNMKKGVALTPADFAYKPPPGARDMSPSVVKAQLDKRLVPIGHDAPAFTLPTPTGGQVALADMLKGKKAVMVNFWFYT